MRLQGGDLSTGRDRGMKKIRLKVYHRLYDVLILRSCPDKDTVGLFLIWNLRLEVKEI